MTKVPLSSQQHVRLGGIKLPNNEVFVLSNNVNVARCIIIYADDPERMDRVYISAGGKIVARFKYRQVQDPAEAVA